MRLVKSPLHHKNVKKIDMLGQKRAKRNDVPEPVDEKDDAQAFASLILVVAVKLRKLGHNPKTDTQHSEGKTNDIPLEQYMQHVV